jgi:hypothetical protein
MSKIKEVEKQLELGRYRRKGFDYLLTAYVGSQPPHLMSVTTSYEPCKGILTHWGTPDELIAELKWTIERLEELKKYLKEEK